MINRNEWTRAARRDNPNMITKRILFSTITFVVLLSVGQANAGHAHCDICRRGCQQHHLVAKTIRVPCTVVEIQMKSRVVCSAEEREETYTAFRRVPTTETYEKETCYLDPEVKTKKVTTKQCKLVPTTVNKTFAVNVPTSEMREVCGNRSCCADCCPEKPCLKCVIRLHREQRYGCFERDQLVFEETTKDIFYCVETPKKRKEFCFSETFDKLEPVQKTRKVVVCVPKIVKEPCEVEVTKMLPKVIYCCEACGQRSHGELLAKLRGHRTDHHGKIKDKLGEKKDQRKDHREQWKDQRKDKFGEMKDQLKDKRESRKDQREEKWGK